MDRPALEHSFRTTLLPAFPVCAAQQRRTQVAELDEGKQSRLDKVGIPEEKQGVSRSQGCKELAQQTGQCSCSQAGKDDTAARPEQKMTQDKQDCCFHQK